MTSPVAAIVLAAGRSSRMAPRNKLLEPIEGEAMIRRVARRVLSSCAEPVIVVTGHHADLIGSALDGLPVQLVHNPDFASGMSSSLRAGIAAVPQSADGALIVLGDMPWVETSVFEALLAAFLARGPDAISVPVHQRRRGNPILWGRPYFREMLKLSGDEGAKRLLVEHEAHVIEIEVETDSIIIDADTSTDLTRRA